MRNVEIILGYYSGRHGRITDITDRYYMVTVYDVQHECDESNTHCVLFEISQFDKYLKIKNNDDTKQ